MFDFIGDLVGSVSNIFGGGGNILGGSGGGVLGLGSNILGGGSGGLFSSPIFGNVIGAIGMELLRDDPVEVARKTEAARLDEIREHSYGFSGPTPTRRGLPTTAAPPPPRQPTAAKYLPGGRLV